MQRPPGKSHHGKLMFYQLTQGIPSRIWVSPYWSYSAASSDRVSCCNLTMQIRRQYRNWGMDCAKLWAVFASLQLLSAANSILQCCFNSESAQEALLSSYNKVRLRQVKQNRDRNRDFRHLAPTVTLNNHTIQALTISILTYVSKLL